MRKRLQNFAIAGVLTASFMIAGVGAAQAATLAPVDGSSAPSYVELLSDNVRLRVENATLRQQTAVLKAKNSTLQRRLKLVRKANKRLSRRVRVQGRLIKRHQRKIARLQRRIRVLSRKLQGTRYGTWQTARVSWYGPGFYGRTMAGGGVLTPSSMVVAHRTMSFGTKIQFAYNGRTAVAEVRDRGPYIGGRTFDLGPGTAHALGFSGVGYVKWRVVKR